MVGDNTEHDDSQHITSAAHTPTHRSARVIGVLLPRSSLLGLAGAWLVLLSLVPSAAQALARDLGGSWYQADAQFSYARQPRLPRTGLTRVEQPHRTGGLYYYEADLVVERADTYVVDFKNSTTLGSFRHYLFAADGSLVEERAGGIERSEENPFLMRHGRDVWLSAGRYHLITELDSPFLLAAPEPFLQPLREYRRDIKAGNALALGALGALCALGFYYAALALSRRRLADLMYVLFIVGNVLYNGSALLLFSDLLGAHWFYLVSVPILFSNIAYVLFVVALLEITPRGQPYLYRSALALLAVLASFVLAAAAFPSWSLELDRYGVGLLTTYGLVAAIARARHGHSSARLYVVAIGAFFLLGGASISLSRIDAHTLYVEHLGLLAVVVEAALLALVLAHQFSLLHSEKTLAERRAHEGFRMAHRDALTGLPNRYSLDSALTQLPPEGSLTFIDLDGLKHYNDKYGHSRGDELLCSFAQLLVKRLGERAKLYRLSGDEFAVISVLGEVDFVAEAIEAAIAAMRRESFAIAGASFGSVFVNEDPSRENLKHIADTRMYENKRVRRASAPAEWLREPYVVPPESAADESTCPPAGEVSAIRRTLPEARAEPRIELEVSSSAPSGPSVSR